MSPAGTTREAPGSGGSLTGDTVLMFASKALVGLLNFSATVVVAHAFGPSGQGVVAVALGLALLLTQLGNLGIVTANPAFVARAPSSAATIVANSVLLAIAIGAVLVAGAAAIEVVAPQWMPELGTAELVLVLAAVPFALGSSFLRAVLLGQRRMPAYNLGELAISAATLAAVAAGIGVFGVGTRGALALLLAQYPVGVVLYGMLAARGRGRPLKPDLRLARSMAGFASRVYVATLMGYLLVRLDLLLVSGFLGSRQAGLYSAALVLAQALYLLPMAIGLNLFPRVAGGEGPARTAAVFRLTAIVLGAACVVAAALGGPALRLLFGAAYEDAVPLFQCLLLAIYALGMLTILTYHFAGDGYPLAATLAWVLGLVLNVALNVALLEPVGTIAAPLVSVLCYAVVLALHMRLFARLLGGWGPLVPRGADVRRCAELASHGLATLRSFRGAPPGVRP